LRREINRKERKGHEEEEVKTELHSGPPNFAFFAPFAVDLFLRVPATRSPEAVVLSALLRALRALRASAVL